MRTNLKWVEAYFNEKAETIGAFKPLFEDTGGSALQVGDGAKQYMYDDTVYLLRFLALSTGLTSLGSITVKGEGAGS